MAGPGAGQVLGQLRLQPGGESGQLELQAQEGEMVLQREEEASEVAGPGGGQVLGQLRLQRGGESGQLELQAQEGEMVLQDPAALLNTEKVSRFSAAPLNCCILITGWGAGGVERE